MLVLRLQQVLSRFYGFRLPSPCLWGKLQSFSFSKVSSVKAGCSVVAGVAGVARPGILTCLHKCRKSFCVTSAILSQGFQKMTCILRGQAQHFGDLHRHLAWQAHYLAHSIHSTLTLHTLRFTLYTPHFTLYTPHSTFRTLRFTLHTLHFTLHTLHSTLYTLHSTLYIPHFTLYTPHSSLYTPHFALYTLHSTLYIPHFTLYTPHSSLYTPHFALYTLHFTLYTPHFTLHTQHSTFFTFHNWHSTPFHIPQSTVH